MSGTLKKHINAVHKGQKNHNCDTCGKSFSGARRLRNHINSVLACQKNHKCDSCGKVFKAESLRQHIMNEHNNW